MAAQIDIRISKESEVTIHDQLAEEITFLIATGELKPGEALPSVRAMARRLRIHHNTVSQVYQDLVGRSLLVRRRGSRRITVFAPTLAAISATTSAASPCPFTR